MFDKFYLGYMLSSHGGVAETVSTRIGSAWKGLDWQIGFANKKGGDL